MIRAAKPWHCSHAQTHDGMCFLTRQNRQSTRPESWDSREQSRRLSQRRRRRARRPLTCSRSLTGSPQRRPGALITRLGFTCRLRAGEVLYLPTRYCIFDWELKNACAACQVDVWLAYRRSGVQKGVFVPAGRWQSQERAQLLKGKKLHERQLELEDALIDLKVSSWMYTSLYEILAWLAGRNTSALLPSAAEALLYLPVLKPRSLHGCSNVRWFAVPCSKGTAACRRARQQSTSALQRDADESAHAAEQARAEAAELLNRLHAKDAAVASAESARDDALRQARSAGT